MTDSTDKSKPQIKNLLFDNKRKKRIIDISPNKSSKLINDEEENELVAVEPKYKEIYINDYCFRDDRKEQYYAMDEDKNQYYRRHPENDHPLYAYRENPDDENQHEYPARDKDGKPIYIYYEDGMPMYPEIKEIRKIIFPKNPDTGDDEYLPDKSGKLPTNYPRSSIRTESYAQAADKSSIVLGNKYAETSSGTQIYPKNAEENEYYLKLGNVEIPAQKMVTGTLKDYYAKKKNGDEIYPREYFEDK